MVKIVADIVADVKVCIDEIGLNDANLLAGSDNAEMEHIIRGKIEEAARYAILNGDLSLLEPVVEEKNGAISDGVVTIILDEDFLRLCFVRLPDWKFAATSVIYYNDKEYASLHNKITTGYPDNPKVAIVEGMERISGEVRRVRKMELYSSEHPSVILGYVKEPKIEDDGLYIAEKMYRGVVYYIAGLTLLTYKDAHADSLFNQSMNLLGIQTK